MRIAYLTSQYPAASHTFIRREVAALRRAGVDVATFSVRKPGSDELRGLSDRQAFDETMYLLPAKPLALAAAHGWALVTRPNAYLRTLALAWRHRPAGVRAMFWAGFHFVEAIYLAHMLARSNVAQLHNHFANSGATVGLLAAHLLGLPWSLTLHGISETDYPAGPLLPEKLRMASFAACVSWFGRAQAMRVTAPALWDKLILVRCGIEPAVLPPRRNDTSANFRIVCIGRLSPEKGQIGLIDACAELMAHDRAIELILIGDGSERSGLEARAAARGIDVLFRGRLTETETLEALSTADLLVLPSFMEGLPVVLMEAMAIGVPVIASHVAGIPELVLDGETGLLFPASNWEDMLFAIRRLLDDPELRTRLAVAGKAKVMAEFNIDRAIVPLLERFGDVPLQLAQKY